MYNQYDQSQSFYYTEATKLAASGEEFSHLVTLLNPDRAIRLRVFVQQLPEEIRNKTIYGRAVGKNLPPDSKKRKPRSY